MSARISFFDVKQLEVKPKTNQHGSHLDLWLTYGDGEIQMVTIFFNGKVNVAEQTIEAKRVMTETFRYTHSRTVRGMDVDDAYEITYEIHEADPKSGVMEASIEVVEVCRDGKPIPESEFDSLQPLFEMGAGDHFYSLPAREEVC